MTVLQELKQKAVNYITKDYNVADKGNTIIKIVDSFYRPGVCGRIFKIELFCLITFNTYTKYVVTPIQQPAHYLV